jgi:hypothetical protein
VVAAVHLQSHVHTGLAYSNSKATRCITHLRASNIDMQQQQLTQEKRNVDRRTRRRLCWECCGTHLMLSRLVWLAERVQQPLAAHQPVGARCALPTRPGRQAHSAAHLHLGVCEQAHIRTCTQVSKRVGVGEHVCDRLFWECSSGSDCCGDAARVEVR